MKNEANNSEGANEMNKYFQNAVANLKKDVCDCSTIPKI